MTTCVACLGTGKVPGYENRLVTCADCLGFGVVPGASDWETVAATAGFLAQDADYVQRGIT